MVSEMKTIKISEEAYKIVELKAKAMGWTKKESAEFMILDFSESTLKERRQQHDNWTKELRDYIDEQFNPDLQHGQINVTMTSRELIKCVSQAWKRGYNSGWRLFQTRKMGSLCRKPIMEFTKIG
jgi:hypothetical protein